MRSCLICDDHSILREAMVATVRKGWPVVTVHEAEDYPSAWAAASSSIDLCISDLVMPGSDPLEDAQLQLLQPDMPLIILTGSHDDEIMMELLATGVSGFVPKSSSGPVIEVPKSSSGPVIEVAINLVVAGGRYLPLRMLELSSETGFNNYAQLDIRLTRQQRRVLTGLVNGQSNKEIALDLGVAPSTIKFHVDSLFERLEARNRVDAIGKARMLKLI